MPQNAFGRGEGGRVIQVSRDLLNATFGSGCTRFKCTISVWSSRNACTYTDFYPFFVFFLTLWVGGWVVSRAKEEADDRGTYN